MMFARLVVGCMRHLVTFLVVANLHPVVHNVRGMVLLLTVMVHLFLVCNAVVFIQGKNGFIFGIFLFSLPLRLLDREKVRL